MSKNIISIYPGHNANITFYNGTHDSYHVIEVEKLFGIKHCRMESKHYVPFRDEYVNPIEAILRALEIAKKHWNIDNDFDVVINGTSCPDRNFFHQQLNPEVIDYTLNTKSVVNGCPHHVAHMYCAWKQSPFERAYVITADGGGDDGVFNGYELHANGTFHKMWHSHANMGRNMNILGAFVKDIADKTGNQLDIAGKVMGLSAYGKHRPELVTEFKRLINDNVMNNEIINTRKDLRAYKNNPHYYTKFEFLKELKKMSPIDDKLFYTENYYKRGLMFADKCVNSGHWWTEKGKTDTQPINCYAVLEGQDGYDWCFNLQKAVEEILLEKVNEYYQRIKDHFNNNLLMSGGVVLNVLVNEAIRREFSDLNTYVPPNPADGGLSFGTLVEYRARKLGDISRKNITYSGPPISDPENEYYTKHDFVTEKDIADRLKQGQIIGLIQGGSEVGPRALGNRSILCDPSIPGIKDKLNAEVKFREWYRPFAPVCKLEDLEEYFNSTDYKYLQYMSFALDVKPKYKEILKAVTHVDNTARVQTVTKGQNKILYEILQHHGGVLLNTSFNVQGKPILNTIDEAFHILNNTGLDAFVYDGTRGLQLYEVK